MKQQTGFLKHFAEPAALGVWLAEQCAKKPCLYLVVAQNPHDARDIIAYVRLHLHDDIPITLFPDSGLLPYDYLTAQESVVAERLALLRNLPKQTVGIVVVSLPTLLRRLPPVQFVAQSEFALVRGNSFDYSRTLLLENGYRQVSYVDSAGEFCRRGEVVDIFPINAPYPLRITLDDDTIESIHILNQQTQRSERQVDDFTLLSRQEFPFDTQARQRFCACFQQRFTHTEHNSLVLHAEQGTITPGFDSFLPLFFEGTASLFDFLPEHTQIITADNAHTQDVHMQWHAFITRKYNLEQERNIAALAPDELLLSEQELFTAYKRHKRLVYTQTDETQQTRFVRIKTHLTQTAHLPLAERCLALLETTNYTHLFVLVNNIGRAQVLLEKMQQLGITAILHTQHNTHKIQIAVADVTCGFGDTHKHTLYIPLTDLEQTRYKKQNQNHATPVNALALHDIQTGEYLVHYEHGVGRFLGIEQDGNEEFIRLEYAKSQTLFVPMSLLHMLSRYTQVSEKAVDLHTLGNQKWQKAKQTAWKKAQDTAAELLALQAARKHTSAPVCSIDEDSYRSFVDAFIYQETEDQKKAIADIERDMQKSESMDRLLCGDVGLGKTEVALRAAFLAVSSGYQVALLVPTTLLCEQHFERIQERFSLHTHVRISMLSRLYSGKECNRTLAQLRSGDVDIVVGTHSLLKQKNLFSQLGLLIIDEEQRFGVKQKEALVHNYKGVHILSMTATPIPRSLYMAMNSLRDLSLMTTPPKNRLSIKTLCIHNHGASLTDGMVRELERGGQVFYLHNQVATIEKEGERLKKLMPQHTIGVAHGQLANHELEAVMTRFYHRQIDILICSTIIETGIDIPNVNTIIIQKAHQFGLAQLHQLRGRVGRAHLQAYCYLVVPETLTKDAKGRIDSLLRHDNFGDGFNIAVNDLEMRGAGDLLGKEQSGHIDTVGVGLYVSMIERSMRMIESGEIAQDAPLFDNKVDMQLHFSLVLPYDYIPTTEARIVYYQRIARATTHTMLDEIKQELLNRFGTAPIMVDWLFALQHLQLKAHKAGIRTIRSQRNRLTISFHNQETAKQDTLIQTLLVLITRSPTHYTLQPNGRFIIHEELGSESKTLDALKRIIDELNTRR